MLLHDRPPTSLSLCVCVCACDRYIAHNGEINTLKGNVNLVHAREGVMKSGVFDSDLYKLYPIIEPGMSDSGCFDNVVEFLCYAGQRELPEVSCDDSSRCRLHCAQCNHFVIVTVASTVYHVQSRVGFNIPPNTL